MKNIRFILFVVGFLLFHFAMTIVYVTPKKYFPKIVETLSKWYMAPQFDQAWDLFAPNPPIKEKTMFYRVKFGENWSEWRNPGEELLKKHDRFRFSNASILFRMNQNAAFHLWQANFDAEKLKESRGDDFNINEYLRNSFGYRVSTHYCWQKELSAVNEAKFDSLELRLDITTPPSPESEGNWQSETYFYPIFDVKLASK